MSESLIDELAMMWVLVASRPAKPLSTGKTSLHLGGRPVTVAVDEAGARHLLIPVDAGADQRSVWRNATLTVSRRNLRGEDRVVRTWLDLHCRRAELEDVFARLAAVVTGELVSVPVHAIEQACIAALGQWRDLFGQGRPQEESVVGLLGELLVLQRLAEIAPGLALTTWTGPSGGRHDFRYGSHAIEVKSTTRRVGFFVQIHGLWQLLAPDDGDLNLAFIRLERVPGGSLTVAGMFRRLVAIGINAGDLAEVMGDLGMGDMQSEAANFSFEPRERTWYPVADDFPKIVPMSFVGAKLPAGVMDIGYGIDLSSQRAIPDASAAEIISRFLSGAGCS